MEFLSFLYLPLRTCFVSIHPFIPADSSPLLHQPAKGHGKADAVAAENQKTARKI